jgi:hypothetical protein
MSTQRTMTALGLAVGAAGIGILWGAGIDFPFYPPPGLLILAAGAVFVVVVRARWAPVAGPLLGVFMVIGFLASSGIDNLTGGAGAGVAVGSAVQLTGVVVATVAGLLALRRTVHT